MAKNADFLIALNGLNNTAQTRDLLKKWIEVDLISPSEGHTAFAEIAIQNQDKFNQPSQWLDHADKETLLQPNGDPEHATPANDVRQLQRIAAEKYITFLLADPQNSNLQELFEAAQKDNQTFRAHLLSFGAFENEPPGWNGGDQEMVIDGHPQRVSYGEPSLSDAFLKDFKKKLYEKMLDDFQRVFNQKKQQITEMLQLLDINETKYIQGHLNYLEALEILEKFDPEKKLMEKLSALSDTDHEAIKEQAKRLLDELKQLSEKLREKRKKYGAMATNVLDSSRESYFRMSIVTIGEEKTSDSVFLEHKKDQIPRNVGPERSSLASSGTENDDIKMKGFCLNDNQVARFTADCKNASGQTAQAIFEFEPSGRVIDKTAIDTFKKFSPLQKCEIALEMAVRFLEQYDPTVNLKNPKDEAYQDKKKHVMVIDGCDEEQVARVYAACLYLTRGNPYYKKIVFEVGQNRYASLSKDIDAFRKHMFEYDDRRANPTKQGIYENQFKMEKDRLRRITSTTKFHRSELWAFKEGSQDKKDEIKSDEEYDLGRTLGV